jgi:predicted Fe-Mo cluster-binding NifX family protein
VKILVATTKGGLEDQVCPTFGRAPTFTVVEVEDGRIGSVEVVPNPAASAAGGAGIQAAQWAANSGAKAVIAGNYGPNAAGVLAQAGVEMLSISGLTVREAVERYLKGELAPFSAGAMAAPGFGPGMGRGGGMGWAAGWVWAVGWAAAAGWAGEWAEACGVRG